MTFSLWGEASDIVEWCDDDDLWQLETLVCPIFNVHELYVLNYEVFLIRPNMVTLTVKSFHSFGPLPLPLFTVKAILVINNGTWGAYTIHNISHIRLMLIFVVDNFENIESMVVHVTLKNVN